MTDEQRIAMAHLARVRGNVADIPLTEQQYLSISSLAMLMDDVMSGNRMAIQERVRVTLRLMEPANEN